MSIVNVLMDKQITCLPNIFDKYASKYYNNALGNSLFWCFMIWLSIHIIFDKFINAFLRRMKFPEYMRCRILSSLWNFGFSIVSLMYCYVAVVKDNMEILTRKYIMQEKDVPGQYILGYVVLCAYFAQSAFWEASCNGFTSLVFECFIMTICALFFYSTGCIEIFFGLVCVVGLSQCVLEISRTFNFQMQSKMFFKVTSWGIYVVHMGLSAMVFFFIPIQFLFPAIRGFMFNPSLLLASLTLFLITWFGAHVYNSAIFKAAKHYLWHLVDERAECDLALLECSMFPKRDDTAFNVFQIRKKIHGNKYKSTTRKKPNGALIQTVKCVLAMKRKLKHKREVQEKAEASNICAEIVEEIFDSAMTKIM